MLGYRSVTVEQAEEIVDGRSAWNGFVKGNDWGSFAGMNPNLAEMSRHVNRTLNFARQWAAGLKKNDGHGAPIFSFLFSGLLRANPRFRNMV